MPGRLMALAFELAGANAAFADNYEDAERLWRSQMGAIHLALWDPRAPGHTGGRNDYGRRGRKHGERPSVAQELLPVRLEQGRKD